jgi:hypothetical protein
MTTPTLTRSLASGAPAALALLLLGTAAFGGPVEDAYIAGYATAVLERQLEIAGGRVTVKDGVVTVELSAVSSGAREKLVAALSRVAGVARVVVVEVPPAPGPATAATETPQPTQAATPTGTAVETEVPPRTVAALPKGYLFSPLIADPRWPHFSAAYQRFVDDPHLRNASVVSLGETLGLLRGDTRDGGAWELGLQAAVFSLFDLDAPSVDLANADYIIGVPVSYRRGDLSALVRIFHQSSHLGDEFLVRNRVERVNLSFEAADLRLSYDVADWLRVYGGGGYLVRRDPSDLAPWFTQAGVEFRSTRTFLGDALRPLAAVDIQNREQNGWSPDISIRAGIQFEKVPIFDRRFQLLLEYFSGHSPNGQFFRDKIEYIGLGLHLYLF